MAAPLGWYFAASMLRLTRSSMLEVLGSEYIKLARLKGLPDIVVGNKAGTFVLLHEKKTVTREEWENAQPKRR